MSRDPWSFVAVRRLWAPLFVLAVHATLVLGFDAYTLHPQIDILTHLAGGAAAAFVFAGILAAWRGRFQKSTASRKAPSKLSLVDALLVLAAISTVAVFWEFGEYVSDVVLRTALQRGLADTLKDLAMGMSGGAAYLAFGPES